MFKKYLYLIVLILTFSCTSNFNYYEKVGFAKVSKSNDIVSSLPKGTLIKISNFENKQSLTIRTTKRDTNLKTRLVALPLSVYKKISLDKDFPLVQALSVKDNKSFTAKNVKIYKEEKTVANKVDFNKIEIQSIVSNKINEKKILLNFGPFYYKVYADNFYKILKFSLKNKSNLFKDYKDKNYLISIGPITNLKEFDNIYLNLSKIGLTGFNIKLVK
jgi:hypothetical protein